MTEFEPQTYGTRSGCTANRATTTPPHLLKCLKFSIKLLPHFTDCLQQNKFCSIGSRKVFWPEDNSCYSLLEQGPCRSSNEWLVLDEDSRSGKIRIRCSARPCPCRSNEPLLCEVVVRNFERQNGCRFKRYFQILEVLQY